MPTREELVRRRAMRTFTARVAGSGVLGTINTANVAAYGTEVDGRYQLTDGAVATWLVKKYGPGAVKAMKRSDGAATFQAQGDLLDSADYQFVKAWKDAYASWYAYWSDVISEKKILWVIPWDGLAPGEAGMIYDEIAVYDATVKQYQLQLNSRGGSVYVSPETPKKSDGSAANPLSTIADSISNVVWIVGIGVLVYLGLVYVVPLFLGAAGQTRSSYRELKEA